MNIDFKKFEDKLAEKFDDMSHLVTEDLIRYWFIQSQGLDLGKAEIEKGYKRIETGIKTVASRARANLVYDENAVIEFEFHKGIKTSATCKTTNMGRAFGNLNKLSMLKDKERYFIYVFDQEMQNYYRDNAANSILFAGNYLKQKIQYKDALTQVNTSLKEFKKGAVSFLRKGKHNVNIVFNAIQDYSIEVLYSKEIQRNVGGKEEGTGFYLIAFKVN